MAGRLVLCDREVIEAGLAEGLSLRSIGRLLGRSGSTIHREVIRNRNRDGVYRAASAQRRADRRSRRPKVAKLDDRRLCRQVHQLLVDQRYSPAAASAVLARRGVTISHETIYREVYQWRFGNPTQVLCRPRPRRMRRTRTGRSHQVLGDLVLIGRRPERVGAGHWEGDLLVGRRNRSAVVVLTETATRYTLVVALANRHADHVADQLIAHIRHRIPTGLRSTLTLDQGREFAQWAAIAAATGFDIYFCEPRSPWQKPLVENTNALLRRWLPRGTVLPSAQPTLDHIARHLNGMPRRSHQWDSATDRYRQAKVATTM